MTACRYHQDYGGGRWRSPYARPNGIGYVIPPGVEHPSCRHPAMWMLGSTPPPNSDRPSIRIPLCALHRRAVDTFYSELKNDPGRWTKI